MAQTIFNQVTTGDIATDSGVSKGANWIDFDNDGDLDLLVANDNSPNFFYENINGTLTRNTTFIFETSVGLQSSGSFGDFDNDGFVDLVLNGNLYKNNAGTSFSDLGQMGDRSAWADVNRDGFLDLFAASSDDSSSTNQLFINNGDGSTFTERLTGPIVSAIGGFWSPAFGDYNNDGWPDLFVTQSNPIPGPNLLYKNNGDGTFTSITGIPAVTQNNGAETVNWMDYDNDGDLDLFVGGLNLQDAIFRNDGNDTFTNIIMPIGEASTSNWGDYDNDGDLDLITGSLNSFTLVRNDGNGVFTVITETSSGINTNVDPRGTVWGDYDNDGDLDLFVALLSGANPAGVTNALYENNGNSNSSIKIKCIGTTSNKSAIGAKVRIKATIFGQTYWQMREINSLTGHRSQNGLVVHFGLGDAAIIDSLKIEWPSGLVEDYANLPANQLLTITEGTPLPQTTFTRITLGEIANDAGDGFGMNWIDFDNDDDLDLFIGNTETDNFLYVNDGSGRFTKNTSFPFLSHAPGAGSVGSFGDYDNDGFIDLWSLNLYKNLDGSSYSLQPLNNLPAQGGVWCELNNDGFLDLFLSGPVNQIFIGDANGSFTEITGHNITVPDITQFWGDYNGDGWVDLYGTRFGLPRQYFGGLLQLSVVFQWSFHQEV